MMMTVASGIHFPFLSVPFDSFRFLYSPSLRLPEKSMLALQRQSESEREIEESKGVRANPNKKQVMK